MHYLNVKVLLQSWPSQSEVGTRVCCPKSKTAGMAEPASLCNIAGRLQELNARCLPAWLACRSKAKCLLLQGGHCPAQGDSPQQAYPELSRPEVAWEVLLKYTLFTVDGISHPTNTCRCFVSLPWKLRPDCWAKQAGLSRSASDFQTILRLVSCRGCARSCSDLC